MSSGRPDRHEWHLRGCDWLAEMADCTRRPVGSLIVGPDKRIWGMGYNGTRPGEPGCLEGACPRGRHYVAREDGNLPVCACGKWWPCPDAVAPGSSYDTGPGVCISSHAEMNAKNDALRRGGGDLAGCLQYINHEPCEGCIREIRNSTRIEAMIWPEGVIALP